MKHPKFNRRGQTGLALAATLALATAPLAAVEADAAKAQAKPLQLSAGQQKAVDAFRAKFPRDVDAVKSVKVANGMQAVKLGGQFASVFVVKRNAEGKFETRCVESADEYAAFLAAPTDAARTEAQQPKVGEN